MSKNLIALVALAALVGCGGGTTTKPDKPPASASSKKSGGYYLDDGPGDNPPANLDQIPDAVPRYEPPQSRFNKPYTALGQSYTPMTQYQPYKARGLASWYGKRYHGQKTSTGEIYDMYAMTAAHTTLPIPGYARVTSLANGKSVVVRVNDRGPFHKDRIIDLSYAAAHRLGIAEGGSGMVEVEAIDARQPQKSAAPETPAAASPAISSSANSASGAYVQAGAFRSRDNAEQLLDKLRQRGLAENVTAENWYNDDVYRVRLGPYSSRDEAERAAASIRDALGISTLVTTNR
ncbi:MAG: septal ring lytic transglycosylase RlpA family protein [Methylobacillus sp.]|jgi:rare lipoprotein A|nr:septal ring lytic transglycosylase RlpA family protein [Methylobacillus sp.]